MDALYAIHSRLIAVNAAALFLSAVAGPRTMGLQPRLNTYGKLNKTWDEARAKGWTVAKMKND